MSQLTKRLSHRIQLPMNKQKQVVLDRADQQQGPKKRTMVTTRTTEKFTVDKYEFEALRKAAKEDAKKKREIQKMTQEHKNLQQQLEKMKSELEAAKEREKSATMTVVTTSRKIKTKPELNEDLVQHTMTATKTFLFCQTKFVEDIIQEERELAEEIIPHLGVTLPISKEEFVNDNSGIVYNGIKAACTDFQSNATKKRAQGLLCDK